MVAQHISSLFTHLTSSVQRKCKGVTILKYSVSFEDNILYYVKKSRCISNKTCAGCKNKSVTVMFAYICIAVPYSLHSDEDPLDINVDMESGDMQTLLYLKV